jgi:hypothetical protein
LRKAWGSDTNAEHHQGPHSIQNYFRPLYTGVFH